MANSDTVFHMENTWGIEKGNEALPMAQLLAEKYIPTFVVKA